MKGSGGNSHFIDKGNIYFTGNDFIIGYLVAKETTLLHLEHGKKIGNKKYREIKLINDIYEIRRQHEDTNTGMKPVID